MDEIKAEIERIDSEITKCNNLKSELDGLSEELSGIGEGLIASGVTLSVGGFIIDGSGADVYAFGGFQSYVDNNITPMTEGLDTLSGELSDLVDRYKSRKETLQIQLGWYENPEVYINGMRTMNKQVQRDGVKLERFEVNAPRRTRFGRR